MNSLSILNVRTYEKELIEKALNRSSEVLSNVLGSQIDVEKIHYGKPKTVNGMPLFYENTNQEVCLLRTQLFGDLNGICHLILSDEEVNEIQHSCLPFKAEGGDADADMKNGFLLEIDNIISGAVTSIFSDEFDSMIYGGVPSMHLMKISEVNNYLLTESSSFELVINFKAKFKGSELNIAPEFIWMLDSQFLVNINNLLDNQKLYRHE